ncbi:MAG: trigger factor [Nitrospinota bacterium]|nr:trigger factor [Nitrospinota bacterium]
MTTTAEDIKIETTDVQPCVKKLDIEIPEPLVSKEYAKALNSIRKTAAVQGFRKGKAPKEILEKLYSHSLLLEVGQKMINDSYEKAVTDKKVRVYGDPAIENVVVEQGKPISYSATVETIPEVKLPDYSSWSFDKKIEKLDESEVEKPIQNTLEQFAELVPADENPVKEGDFIIADYSATMDGKVMENMTGENREMIIDSSEGNLLASFFEQIIGMKKGEEKEFTVKLSKQFPDPELADKEALFKVKIHSIKEKKLPELNDEFVSTNTSFKTVEEMKESIRKNQTENLKRKAEEMLRMEIVDKFIKETKFELPPNMVGEYANMHANRVRERARWSGIDLEKSPGFKKDEFEKACLVEGERLAREDVIISAISEQADVKPDPKEIMNVQKEYLQMIENQGSSAKNMENARRRALSLAIKEVQTGTVYKYLFSKLNITEKTVDKKKEKK